MNSKRKVIDSHWHLYPWFDEHGEDFYTVIDRYQKNLGLDALNLCSIPVNHDYGPAQNVLAALYKLHNPTAYAYGGLVYTDKPVNFPQPEGFDMLTQYNELMEIGFDGIKMLETKPAEQKEYQVRINDPYFEEFFAACEKNGTHMIWHVADPDTFWDINKIPQRFIERGWFYGDGTYMSLEEMYGQVYDILERHPKLKVTFAHFFFLSEHPEKLEELFAKYENACIDIVPGGEMYAAFRENYEFYKGFFEKYSDRIFFGTDASFTENDLYDHYTNIVTQVYNFMATDKDIEIYGEKCPAIQLSDEATDNILYKNFERVAGSTPKAVNKAAIKKYVEKYKPYFTDKKLLKIIEDAVKEF